MRCREEGDGGVVGVAAVLVLVLVLSFVTLEGRLLREAKVVPRCQFSFSNHVSFSFFVLGVFLFSFCRVILLSRGHLAGPVGRGFSFNHDMVFVFPAELKAQAEPWLAGLGMSFPFVVGQTDRQIDRQTGKG